MVLSPWQRSACSPAPETDAQSSQIRVITAEDTDHDDDPDIAIDERLPATVELFVDGNLITTLTTLFTGVHPGSDHDNLGNVGSGSAVVVCQQAPVGYHFILAEIGGVAQTFVADPEAMGRACVGTTASTSNINVLFLNEKNADMNVLTLDDIDRNGIVNFNIDERVPVDVELFINGQSANTLTTTYTGIEGSIAISDTVGTAGENDIVIVCVAEIADTTVAMNSNPATDPDGLNRTCGTLTISAANITAGKIDFAFYYLPPTADMNVLTVSDTDRNGALSLSIDERRPAEVELFVNGHSVSTLTTTYTGLHGTITTSDTLGGAAENDPVIVCAADIADHTNVSINANPTSDPDGLNRTCGTFTISAAHISNGKLDFIVNYLPDIETADIKVLSLSDTDRTGTLNFTLDPRVPAEVELFVNDQSVNTLTTTYSGIEDSIDTVDTLGTAAENDTIIVCAADVAGHTSLNIGGLPIDDPDDQGRSCGRTSITSDHVASGQLGIIVIYFPAGDLYHPVPPSRILDTRPGFLSFGQPSDGPDVPIGAGDANIRTLNVSFLPNAGIPVQVNAVAIHVTSVAPTANSFLTIWSDGPRPNAASKNFGITAGGPFGYAGLTNDLLIVPVGDDGSIQIYNDAGTVDLVIDIVGYYTTSGDLYNPLAPSRILDTRPGFDSAGNPLDGPDTPIGAGDANTRTITVADLPAAGVPANATAVAIHVTSVSPTADSFLTIWPDGIRPNAASKYYGITAGGPFGYAGLTNDLLIVPVGPNGTVQVNNDAGTVDLVIDIVGYYAPTGDLYNPLIPSRILDTRPGFDSAGNPASGPDTPIGAGDANTRTIVVARLPAAGVPANATAVAIHVTSVSPTANSFLTVWPDGPRPNAASKNYGITAGGPFGYAGLTNDLLIVPVGPDGTIQIYNDAGTVDLVIDVVGYTTEFNPPSP